MEVDDNRVPNQDCLNERFIDENVEGMVIPTATPSLASPSVPATTPFLPPLVHIHYYDNDHAQGIYQLIEAYMLSLQSGPNGDRLRQQVMAVSRDADDEECVSTDEQQLCNVDESAGQVVYHLEYCLDKFAMTYKTQVLFDQIYMEPFWIDNFVERQEKRLRRMAIKCFNCGGDHHLNQCTESHDTQRIMEQSKSYRDAVGPQGADRRYHMALVSDRFSKFKPGMISSRLHAALGLEPGDIPPYITRMCLLGYPPGYRIQAKEELAEALLLYGDPGIGEPVKKTRDIIYPGFNASVVVPAEHTSAQIVEEADDQTLVDYHGDDLGTLSGDYELEEVNADDGEMVIGFCINKSPEPLPLEDPNKTKKQFSLDFPPGLVDLASKAKSTSEQWNSIRQILGHN